MTNSYQQQLAAKISKIDTLFADFDRPELEVFTSPEKHYRMRAEFRVWHQGDELYYIMFDKATREQYRVDQFPAASVLINKAMPLLMAQLRPEPVLRHKLFQVDFLSTQRGELIISLLYHRKLDEQWQAQAASLKTWLTNELGAHVELIGRARKQKIELDHDHVMETLQVNGQAFHYRHIENSFTQPNAVVCEKMISWAVSVVGENRSDLVELYCGNGNFTLPLAGQFRRVLATEIAKPSVQAAHFNLQYNAISNVDIARLSSEEFTQAWEGQRRFRRLADIDLSEFDAQTLFVDPPRAGLDEQTLYLASQFPRILYISCNPHTLQQNLKALGSDYRIERMALFDQFPYTEHMEMGVWLVKASAKA